MYECQSKPKVYINFNSPDGNIYSVLTSAANAIKRYSIYDGNRYIAEMKERVLRADDYGKALDIICEYVDIICYTENSYE